MTAHCAVACGGAVMMLAMVLSSLSVGLPWWTNSTDESNTAAQNLLGATSEVKFSLWEMEMTVASETVKAKHDDMCSISSNADNVKTYCNKIRAARATTIMTAVFAFASVVTLLYGYCNDQSWLICSGLFTSALAIANAASAVGLGVALKKDNVMLDSPMFGFIGICMALGFASVSFLLALLGQLKSGKKGGFRKHGGGYKGYGNRPPVGSAAPPRPVGNPYQPYPQPVPQPVGQYRQQPERESPYTNQMPGDFGIQPGDQRLPLQQAAPAAGFQPQQPQQQGHMTMPPLPKNVDYY